MLRNRQMVIDRLESRCYLTSVGWDGPGMGEASLTYYLGEVPPSVDEAIFRDAIEQALDVWGDVVLVDFTETEIPRLRNSIDVTFDEIDGPGGKLAQAYLPRDVNFGRTSGDIEFDQEESWELGNAQGSAATDLLYVAGDGSELFVRTASRLIEMRSQDYLESRTERTGGLDPLARM